MTAALDTTEPPDPEALGTFFVQPLIVPAWAVTKLEDADDIEDHGAVRIESASCDPVLEFRSAAWDVGFLVHAYSPNEVEASDLSRKVLAHAAAARRKTIMGWYIVDVLAVIGGIKLPEPGVEGLVRYRGAVSWRVAGHPLITE